MRISDWSSDVCSSDLRRLARRLAVQHPIVAGYGDVVVRVALGVVRELLGFGRCIELKSIAVLHVGRRSEEHTSELQSLMRISYAVFCLHKKKIAITLATLIYINLKKV